MAKKKKFTTDNGSRCSGYGVYPDGKKCKGCSDCEGKPVSRKQLLERFNQNHAILKVKRKK
jgi:hypothetical protein